MDLFHAKILSNLQFLIWADVSRHDSGQRKIRQFFFLFPCLLRSFQKLLAINYTDLVYAKIALKAYAFYDKYIRLNESAHHSLISKYLISVSERKRFLDAHRQRATPTGQPACERTNSEGARDQPALLRTSLDHNEQRVDARGLQRRAARVLAFGRPILIIIGIG